MLLRSTLAALLACSALAAQNSPDMILAAGRSGVIELIQPSTLQTLSRIELGLPYGSVGLNGISASADGSTLYVEAPRPEEPNGCCVLYSIELSTLQMKQSAGIPGSRSRRAFVPSEGLRHLAASLLPAVVPETNNIGQRFHLSPDGRWLVTLKLDAPLDLYDVPQRRLVQRLVPQGLEISGWPAGAWSRNRFYLYGASAQGGARLWSMSPETRQLDAGVTIATPDTSSGCSGHPSYELAAAGGNLFVYERFGFKLDRRSLCSVTGGASAIDPSTGQATGRLNRDLYFSSLLSDTAGTELYGLTAETPTWDSAARLVRLDPRDGRILNSRSLDPGFWRIAVAPLRVVPRGNVRAIGY